VHNIAKAQLACTLSAGGLDTNFCIIPAPEDLNAWPAAYPEDPKIRRSRWRKGGLQQIGHWTSQVDSKTTTFEPSIKANLSPWTGESGTISLPHDTFGLPTTPSGTRYHHGDAGDSNAQG